MARIPSDEIQPIPQPSGPKPQYCTVLSIRRRNRKICISASQSRTEMRFQNNRVGDAGAGGQSPFQALLRDLLDTTGFTTFFVGKRTKKNGSLCWNTVRYRVPRLGVGRFSLPGSRSLPRMRYSACPCPYLSCLSISLFLSVHIPVTYGSLLRGERLLMSSYVDVDVVTRAMGCGRYGTASNALPEPCLTVDG